MLRPLPPDQQRTWARKLHMAGLSFTTIGRVMGLSRLRVRYLYGQRMQARYYRGSRRLRLRLRQARVVTREQPADDPPRR